MSKDNRIPNYRKMYPEASDEVIQALRAGKRKMIYYEHDLKTERTTVDKNTQKKVTRPSREDSLERLSDEHVQFSSYAISTEDVVIRKMQQEQLRYLLKELDSEEYAIIYGLFFENKKEAAIATEIGVSQQVVNYRKQKILLALRKKLLRKQK